MKFTIAYSPVTTAFVSMSDKDRDAFYEWFMLNKPYCLDELIHTVWQTPGYEGWSADFSPASLGLLGEWLFFVITTKHPTLKDDHVEENFLSGVDKFEADPLSDQEKSLAVMVGMYYGDVAVRNNPELDWVQLRGSKKEADYGQPVISGPGLLPTNPVRASNAFACGIADGSRSGSRLRETYEHWMTLVKR
ncbi:hypothetical protein HBO08_18580 [Pseudomonas rhodesiae]|uniref:hypothetical protein n=1 Tax=Pseudomonas TaxID=286 RepID=UPI0014752ACF|nr:MULTISPECIES: hypothetical protein [Pseudomonas]MBX4137266.1 hypothetical protein [Pseudomonas sp. S5F11]NMZ19023.1 hypothetical protein [Pseudomonas rhodesiae]